MTTSLVWLLAITNYFHNGSNTNLTPQMFPTVEACQQVLNNLPVSRHRNSRCIQTTVIIGGK